MYGQPIIPVSYLTKNTALTAVQHAPKPDMVIFNGLIGPHEQNILSGDGGDVKIDPK
jgi:hypothetical protein